MGGGTTIPYVRYCPGCGSGLGSYYDCACGYDQRQRNSQTAKDTIVSACYTSCPPGGSQEKREHFLLELAKARLQSGGGVDPQDARMLKRYVHELLSPGERDSITGFLEDPEDSKTSKDGE